MALKVLDLFDETGAKGWAWQAFLELVAGDDPVRRALVLDVVDRLVRRGHLDSRGSDFFTLTEAGRKAARCGVLDGW